MTQFTYTAMTEAGVRVTGALEAESEAAAMRALEEKRLFPVTVSGGASASGGKPARRRVKSRDLVLAPVDKLWRGTGCPNCRNTGYRGRSGLYELMEMSDAISEKIIERAPSQQIVAVAKQGGLRLLREDGWDKVRSGVTTPDEVVLCTAG